MGAILPSGPATEGVRRGLRLTAYALFALFFLLLLLPVLVIATPFGQRLAAEAIERPLLARLTTAVPAPYRLTVDDLETTVRPSSVDVTFTGTQLTGGPIMARIDTFTVRVRYVDILRRTLVPRRLVAGHLHLALGAADEAAFEADGAPPPLVSPAPEAVAPAGLAAADADPVPVPADGVLRSARLDAFLGLIDRLDGALAHATLHPTWASLRDMRIERISLEPQPNSPVPLLRQPPEFALGLRRSGDAELSLTVNATTGDTPVRLLIRHAEEGAPEGPALLAEMAGTHPLEGQAFTHVLMRGLELSALTGALSGDGPVRFDSEIATELVAKRDLQDNVIDQIVLLVESGAGYLLAGEDHATILEMATLPMLYSRQTGRFDIVGAELRFPGTGGRFSGFLGPDRRDGQPGLALVLDAPRYGLAVPPSQILGRESQPLRASIALRAHIPDARGAVYLPLLQLAQGDASLAFSGILDGLGSDPMISLVGRSTPMRVEQLAAIWPLPLSPKARGWFLDAISEGTLGAAEFSLAGRLGDIEMRDGRAYLPDDIITLQLPYENMVMRTVGELPPVFGLDGNLEITGRTVTMTGSGGAGRLPTGETIAVGPVRFHIPDHAQRNPDARLDLAMDGPASGFLRMARMDPLLIEAVPFDPDMVSGRARMEATVEARLSDAIDRDAVRASMRAQLEGFALSEPVDGRRIESGNFSLEAADGLVAVEGTARLDGVPTQIAFTTEDGAGLQVGMRLDAAARQRLGLDFGAYLDGIIDVAIGEENEGGARTFDIDLADARLSIPELGWTKPAGRPAQATFEMVEDGNERRVRNLTLAADGLALRGSLGFRGGELRTAQFDSVALEGVGRFALTLTRNGQATAARISGERFTLRPELLRGDREAAGTLSLELDLDELRAQNGARLADVRLTYAQNGERITAFDLRARHGDGSDLVGTLADRGGNNQLVISSGNAGTFLRFLGLYERATGGRATLLLDPQSVGGRLSGQLLLSDYTIVDEPAMDRIFTSGRDAAVDSSRVVLPGEFETSDRIQIEVTNISFDRTPERLIIHEAEGWGPSLGGNLEGVIDYAADRVALEGTYVPFFTINNLFSRIPLLGTALGNRETEGLLGITFELVGPVDQPQLRVNPMSLLAPGAIRNIFEYRQGG